MGEPTLWDWLKRKIASAAWRVYLWGVELSEEQYRELVFQVETMRREDEQAAQGRETT